MTAAARYMRIIDTTRENGDTQLYVQHYDVDRRTPKGAWITVGCRPKFVLDGNGRRWAYPTLEQAMEDFRRRKKNQVKILTAKLKMALAAQQMGEIIDNNGVQPEPSMFPDWQDYPVPAEATRASEIRITAKDIHARSSEDPWHPVWKENL